MNYLKIVVGARSSSLSKVQVNEILIELHKYHPYVSFEPNFVLSKGDKDLKTSLRTLNKSDFFTKEIDEMLLDGQCRIAIHSAKDLPDPIPKGLILAAITHGLDPADVLVMRPGCTLQSLPANAIIATSSERREEVVHQLRSDLKFVDIRGTIEHRLVKLDSGEVDAVVIAEAALIRLGLAHLNRLRLPGPTVENQGQLAVVARTQDNEMLTLFSCIDSRSKETQ